jgi:hypothetical protein
VGSLVGHLLNVHQLRTESVGLRRFGHQELQRFHLDVHLEQMVPELHGHARRMASEDGGWMGDARANCRPGRLATGCWSGAPRARSVTRSAGVQQSDHETGG